MLPDSRNDVFNVFIQILHCTFYVQLLHGFRKLEHLGNLDVSNILSFFN